jgi:hypothetical protein
MTQPTSKSGVRHRIRLILGIAVVAGAQLACATTDMHLENEVHLSIETVTLSQSNPVQTSRFRIETSYDGIGIEATLSMAEPVAPVEALVSVVGVDGNIRVSTNRTSEFDSRQMKLEVFVDVQCSNGDLCAFDVETSSTAQSLGADVATGTLAVTAKAMGAAPAETKYLSIEPL